MLYIVLTLALLAIAFCLVRFLHFRIISPSVIIAAMSAASSLLAAIGLSSWNTETDLNLLTCAIVIIGVISLALGELSLKHIIRRLKPKTALEPEKQPKKSSEKPILLPWFVYGVIILIYATTIILVIKNLNDICLSHSDCTATSLTGKINFYRFHTSLFSSDPIKFDFITRQLVRICSVLSAISAYIFVHNCFCQTKTKAKLKLALPYLLPSILALVVALLQSSRGGATVPIAELIIIYAAHLFQHQTARKATFKLLREGLIILAIALPVFYISLPLVGRQTNTNFVQYISFYIGCPIPSLNRYVTNGALPADNDYPGQNSFRGLYKFTNRLSITEEKREESLPFISLNGMRSNVYTGFYRFFTDFGILGVALLSYLVGLGYGLLCYLALHKRQAFFLIFYSMFAASIIDFVRDETFFGTFLTTTTVISLFYLFIAYHLLMPNEQKLIRKKKHHALSQN